ncbi:MAG TPA: hypothetical protein ENI75_00630 [Mizugakiibacter sp.]|nr:hypothetical protein [Mizugakiibacter sp.]
MIHRCTPLLVKSVACDKYCQTSRLWFTVRLRYITRPAMSEKRLSLTEHGQVRYSLKNLWVANW